MPSVPDQTSKFSIEPKAELYVIPFAPELINFIKEKLKLRTYRFGRKYDYLKVGDIVELTDAINRQVAARARITKKEFTTFVELPLETQGHEIYLSKEHQRQVFSGYYQYIGRPIKDEDEILVLDFELVSKAN